MSSPPPPPPSPVSSQPSQESFERVFSLQRRVEPDQENHITSSFSILDANNTLALVLDSSSSSSSISDLGEIYYPSRRRLKTRKPLAADCDNSVYEENTTGNLDHHHHNLALLSSTTVTVTATTPQLEEGEEEENYPPLAKDSIGIAILSDSRLKNQLPQDNNNSTTTAATAFTSHPSTTQKPPPPSSIYSHSLIQPICKST